MDLHFEIRGFLNKQEINEFPDSPGRLQKHTDIRRGVSPPIFFLITGQSVAKMDLYVNICVFLNKQVITEDPDSPGRLQKHTDNSVVVRFHIFILFLSAHIFVVNGLSS